MLSVLIQPKESVIDSIPDKLERRTAHRRKLSLLGLVFTLAFAWLLANGISELQWRQIFKPRLFTEGVIHHVESAGVPNASAIPPAQHLSLELKYLLSPVKPLFQASGVLPVQTLPAPVLTESDFSATSGASIANSLSRLAELNFHKATALVQQRKVNEAIASFEAALQFDASHKAARQALVILLLDTGRNENAETILQEGLEIYPHQSGFAMLLARLQLERGALTQAVTTMEKTLPYADTLAGYQAFLGLLLQRQQRHKEAISHYQAALNIAPDNGDWLIAYATSLQAMQQQDEARVAYLHALESKALDPEAQRFVLQKLKEL